MTTTHDVARQISAKELEFSNSTIIETTRLEMVHAISHHLLDNALVRLEWEYIGIDPIKRRRELQTPADRWEQEHLEIRLAINLRPLAGQ